MSTMKLKGDDEIISAQLVTDDGDIVLTSNTSYTVRFDMEELPPTGVKTGGVKGLVLKEGEYVVATNVIMPNDEKDVIVVTHRGAVKRMNIAELEQTGRAKRGLVTLKELKSNPHRVFNVLLAHFSNTIVLETAKGHQEEIQVVNLTRADRYSNGSLRIDTSADGELVRAYIKKLGSK